jgi:hypothetical protein
MTVRYHTRQDRLVPEYVCQRDGIEHAISICQRVVGDHIDQTVGQLLVESVAPLALEVTLSVQQELQARIEEVDKLRKKQVARARYEADSAQRRYLHVDPAHRLVADSRKRMVRLLLADVTLIRGNGITVHVRFSGGATKTLELPRPLTAWELRTTPAEIVAEVDRLTDHHTDKQIVEILNQRGALSDAGNVSTVASSRVSAVITSSNRGMIGYARRAY